MDSIDRELFDEELLKVPPVFRDRTSPFETLNDDEFHQRFRFTRHGFFEILKFVEQDISPSTMRGQALLPAQRLALTLQNLASNSFQITTGDLAGCHQTTVSQIVKQVVDAIYSKVDAFVYWGDSEWVVNQQKNKNYHSINLGLACDSDLRFVWLSAKYPGSAHDSKVFRESQLHSKLMNGSARGVLLGDSAYRAEKYLFKPILNPSNASESNYTNALCRGRVLIENSIGCLKRQFHCLHGELRHSPQRASSIITACVCLRNAAILLKEKPFDDVVPEERDDGMSASEDIPASAEGAAAMRYIISKYF